FVLQTAQAQTAQISLSCDPTTGPIWVGTMYVSTCSVSGGKGSYGWSISSGSLPDGLTLAASETSGTRISGTPKVPGTYSYTVRVMDRGLSQEATHTFRGVINERITLTCNPLTGPSAVGTAYAASCSVRGGTAPYVWSINPGSLPSGLTLTA